MMGPMISKVPLKVSVGVRLHASILNLMLSDYDIVYSGRMCAMGENMLLTILTSQSNEVLIPQQLLQNMAIGVQKRLTSGVS